MKDQSVYQIVTDKIIGLLQKNIIPWQKTWVSGQHSPQNLISRRAYHGLNVFLLNSLNYSSPWFLTYKQAQELGGNVKRGEKGCPVVFWKWLDIENKETGERERIPFLKYFSVFNVQQCESVPVPALPEAVREHSPIETAEKIVASMPKRPEIKHGLAQAFYSPVGDYIGIPAPEQFNSAEEYYSCLLHECTHASGAECRLNRKGVALSKGLSPFGSPDYSFEELIAEMGSAYLCAEAGIVERTINNSASYIDGWLQRLRNDSKLVVQAASAAQKAADFILNRKAAVDNLTEVQPLPMAA